MELQSSGGSEVVKQTNNMPHGKIKLEIWSVYQAECQEVKPLDSAASKLGWQTGR